MLESNTWINNSFTKQKYLKSYYYQTWHKMLMVLKPKIWFLFFRGLRPNEINTAVKMIQHRLPYSSCRFMGVHSRGGLYWGLNGKASACQCRRCGFDPWVRKIPWRRKWQSTLVFLPGNSHGQRSLLGYSPWDCKNVGHNLVTKQQQH